MKKLFINERPAYTQSVKFENQQTFNGYTLQIDFNNQSASIIIQQKGGYKNMAEETILTETKIIRVADKGLEDVYEVLVNRKANLENAKQEEIDKAIAEITERFAEDAEKIENCIKEVSHEEEVEVPVEQSEQTETAETL